MTTFVSDKVDFKAKNIVKDTEGHSVTIEDSYHQEDKTTLKCMRLAAEFQNI